MRALYYNGSELIRRNVPRPTPRRGEVRVRVLRAGICSTDLEILRGYMDFRGVPGHEFVGLVERPAPRALAGRRVTGEINVPCGRCAICRAGLGQHCPRRGVLGILARAGAFADYLCLPAVNLHPVPENVSDEEAVFTELLAAACEIPRRVRITRRERVAVVGDGRLAAMAAQVLAQRTERLVLLGVDHAKMARIASLGIATRDVSAAADLGGAFDVAVECSGSPRGLPVAAALVRPRGVVVLKSTFKAPLRWNPSAIAVDEITLLGSRCGPFDTALDLLARGRVAVRPFLSAVYPFERWQAAFARSRRRGVFKVQLDMSV